MTLQGNHDCGKVVGTHWEKPRAWDEDPATGSLNAGIARWLLSTGQAPARYVVSQGTALGRAGRISVEQVGDDIWIGGAVVTCIDGQVTL
jgi:predicted PhzF superfamily epimerase YddE/YHI9